MKKILFVSLYLPPYLSPQSIQIGRILYYLKNYQDLEIHVLTADIVGGKVSLDLYPEIYKGIKNVIKVPYKEDSYLIRKIKSKLFPFIYQKPDVYLGWMEKAYKEILYNYAKGYFDVVLTFSFPLSTNILGFWLKKAYDCQWIAHQSDPWVDNPYINYNWYTKSINNKLERQCFENADKLIFVSRETMEFYKRKYEQFSSKMFLVEHSFDSSLYPNIDVVGNNEKKIFRYIGSFYGNRTPEPFFKAMKLLDKKLLSKIRFEIIGGGLKVPLLIKKYNLNNYVKIIPTVNYLESLKYMKTSDVLVVIDAINLRYNIFFPSKLADYIGARKPILGISPEGTTKRILTELGYICIDPQDINGIARAIEYCIDNEYQVNIDESMIAKYDIKHNIVKLKELI